MSRGATLRSLIDEYRDQAVADLEAANTLEDVLGRFEAYTKDRPTPEILALEASLRRGMMALAREANRAIEWASWWETTLTESE